MSAALRIHPAALEEAEAAAAWYRERSSQAAEMFLNELDQAIERLAVHPEGFPVYGSGTRKAVLRKFPFVIVFRDTAAGIQIIAVAHGRRRPGYWRDRLEGRQRTQR